VTRGGTPRSRSLPFFCFGRSSARTYPPRLIGIFDTPEDIPFLNHLILREIVSRTLRTPQGERLRAILPTTANIPLLPGNCDGDH